MCLDAWITPESQCDTDTSKLEWLIYEGNHLKTHWKDIPNKRDTLHGLKEVGYVEDMRPGPQRGNRRELTDVTDFEQVIKFIY